ncbi:MAG: hypothetical protein KDE22_14025 [Rhodobacterales bacterium]|nr:hypothetical protein [Rhodobacterales bacterium]
MTRLLKGLQLIALCVFVGSIPAHIVIGALAEGAADAEAFALHHQVKHVLTQGLTGAGLAATGISGVLLLLARRDLLRRRWMQVKLAAMALIAANGGLVLMPLAGRMADLAARAAADGALDPAFAGLAHQESLAGAANLGLILLALGLAVAKPRLGQGRARPPLNGAANGAA